jgi:hypothetical protein
MENIIERTDRKKAEIPDFSQFTFTGVNISPVQRYIWLLAWQQTIWSMTTVESFRANPLEFPREWLN